MTTYDFAPLFRSTVGFDRLARLMDATSQASAGGNGYPHYNISVIGDDHYRITMAVAGFADKDLNIEVQKQTLIVSGKRQENDEGVRFLHRGIAERDFVRKFQLADYVKVAEARVEHGLLTIDLEREIPEEMKPRTIKIEHGAPRSLAEKARKFIEGGKKGEAA